MWYADNSITMTLGDTPWHCKPTHNSLAGYQSGIGIQDTFIIQKSLSLIIVTTRVTLSDKLNDSLNLQVWGSEILARLFQS